MQDEPLGLFWLGDCYQKGIVVAIDLEIATTCFKRAIALGNIRSCHHYGMTFRDDQPEHFLWLGHYASASNFPVAFCKSTVKKIRAYCDNLNATLGPVVFQIGKSLVGHVNSAEKTLFRQKRSDAEWFVAACLALSMYNSWCLLTREAVDSWTIIAHRNGFPRDVRRMVGHVIWESRSQGLYILGCDGSLIRPT